jgi:hypothetical protein
MQLCARIPGPSKAAAAAAAAALAGAACIATATPAAAATKLTVKYRVSGTTLLKAPNATVSLGPGTLKSAVNLSNGTLTAALTLPPATASFKELGLIPVSATTEFLQDGPTTGTINLSTGAVATTSRITLKITSLSIAGIPVPVGNSCESATPATVALTSQSGFSVVNGGSLAGTYTIPPFANCGLLVTPVLNLTVPGPGNTISLRLGKAHRVG